MLLFGVQFISCAVLVSVSLFYSCSLLSSMVSRDLLRRVLPGKDDYGDAWFEMRDKFLSVYGEALSSRCTPLVKMIQVVMTFLTESTVDSEYWFFMWKSHIIFFTACNI